MSAPVYSWFWQPALDGRPGLVMIVDNHPDPRRTDIPVVIEKMADVLHEIESKLPQDIALGSARIYFRDPLERWGQVLFNDLNRRFHVKDPDFSQASLAELWESRL